MRITATYKDAQGDRATAELEAVAFYSFDDMYVHVGTSTEYGQLGENAVLHLRSNFAFQVYSYVVSFVLTCFQSVLIMDIANRSGGVERFGHLWWHGESSASD